MGGRVAAVPYGGDEKVLGESTRGSLLIKVTLCMRELTEG